MDKGRADYLELGDWNVSCAECGRKRKSSMMVRHWQGHYICKEHNEPRHPQDYARSTQDIQTPPWAQPRTYRYRTNVIDIPWTPEGTDAGIIDLPVPGTPGEEQDPNVPIVDPEAPLDPENPGGDPDEPLIVNIPEGTSIRGINFTNKRTVGKGIIFNNKGTALPPRTAYPPTVGPVTHPTEFINPDPTRPNIPIQWNGGPYPPPELIFNVQPSSTAPNTNISPAVEVAAVGNANIIVTTYAGDITLEIGVNGGAAAPGVLSGTLMQGAVSGVATFADLQIDQLGEDYTLVARGTSLPGTVESDAFDILETLYTQIDGPLEEVITAADYVEDQNPGKLIDAQAFEHVITTTGNIGGLTFEGFASGSLITLINEGNIVGAGGAGGTLSAGEDGADGILIPSVGVTFNVENTGTIAGGGGGGGSGGNLTQSILVVDASDMNPLKQRQGTVGPSRGGGGGGGAGIPGGVAGAIGSVQVAIGGWNLGAPTLGVNWLVDTIGTIVGDYGGESPVDPLVQESITLLGTEPVAGTTVGGAGGGGTAGEGTASGTSGAGGAGGGYGTAGSAGAAATGGTVVAPNAGGAAGAAIRYIVGSTVTIVEEGTITGAVVSYEA